MIDATKNLQALGAVNAALVQLRDLARGGASTTEIAALLDTIEYLPRLIADAEDRTSEFGAVLRDLTQQRSEFRWALDRFHAHLGERW
jgi:hypothetical protein